MIKVGWPASKTEGARANIWRILDFSGLTKSVRESRNFTRAGYMFFNGSRVTSLKKSVPLGDEFTLELRFPNGVIKSAVIMLIPFNRVLQLEPRSNSPRKLNYRGNSKVNL